MLYIMVKDKAFPFHTVQVYTGRGKKEIASPVFNLDGGERFT